MEETIELLVKSSLSVKDTNFIVRPTITLKKLMDKFCQKHGLQRAQTAFTWNGSKLLDEDIPSTLRMETGDVIHAEVDVTEERPEVGETLSTEAKGDPCKVGSKADDRREGSDDECEDMKRAECSRTEGSARAGVEVGDLSAEASDYESEKGVGGCPTALTEDAGDAACSRSFLVTGSATTNSIMRQASVEAAQGKTQQIKKWPKRNTGKGAEKRTGRKKKGTSRQAAANGKQAKGPLAVSKPQTAGLHDRKITIFKPASVAKGGGRGLPGMRARIGSIVEKCVGLNDVTQGTVTKLLILPALLHADKLRPLYPDGYRVRFKAVYAGGNEELLSHSEVPKP
jgi:hypothetical protein